MSFLRFLSASLQTRFFPNYRLPRGFFTANATAGSCHPGAWGIFDAPEPWGPWTTAFHTEDWGLGGTHGYRFPAKWIGPDGRTIHLVFSGSRHLGTLYDAFCTRRLTLDVTP